MTIRICASVMPQTPKEALEFVAKAEKQQADFIEVRLDRMKKMNNLSDIANCSNIPKIATNRSIGFGGGFRGPEFKRQKVLTQAAENGFEYVDLELETKDLKKKVTDFNEVGVKTIVSFHDFHRTPSAVEMNNILRREICTGADVCKVVTLANRSEDNVTVLRFVYEAKRNASVVCFCMGTLGRSSRLLSPLFGGFFTIVSLNRESETAPGQFTLMECKGIYEKLSVA